MKNVLLFLTDGFEEVEALTTVDALRRAEIAVKTVSVTGKRTVTGKHDIPVIADQLFEEADFSAAEMLIVPGGTVAYGEHEGLKAQLCEFARAGKAIAAICAAPSILGQLGILEGRSATCYPGFEQYLQGAEVKPYASVVVDGNIITGRGPALALPFALTVIEALKGEAARREVASGMLFAE